MPGAAAYLERGSAVMQRVSAEVTLGVAPRDLERIRAVLARMIGNVPRAGAEP